jgi:Flp pilus assembly pilin Flp
VRVLRRRDDERGAAALEFGLVIPVVLMLIFGIIQYGFMYWSLQTASATAREAARSLIVGTTEACTLDRAEELADNPAVGGGPVAVARYFDTTGAATTGPVEGGLVEVEVSLTTLNLNMPFLPMPDGGNVVQTAEARVENVPPVPLPCT